MLSLEHVARRFGPVRALIDASLTVRPGSVHALLGENGAGKTTLMQIAFGMLQPERGVVRINGEVVSIRSPADALRHGIGMVHQHFTSVPAMTVAENIALGDRGRYHVADARRRVYDVARRTGLSLDPDARAGDLPVGAQQRLEIVKALSKGARILILDEPTAVLVPTEAEELLATLRRFAENGGGVVIITHKLREAIGVADDVTVLRRGQTVFAGPAADASPDDLVRAMLGEPANVSFARLPAARGNVILALSDITVIDNRGVPSVRNASFSVHGGEIVGIAGVEGAGQYELLRVLAGRMRPSSGTLVIPSDVGFVPEDRHRDALVLDFTLYENIALRNAGTARGRISWPSMRAATKRLLVDFDVQAEDVDAVARTLSGGNQQKLVLARELSGSPAALIVENPTRGLDIAATADIHRRLMAARNSGAAIVVHSSDLEEILSLADRIIVMYQGIAREVSMADRTVIGRAMLGGG